MCPRARTPGNSCSSLLPVKKWMVSWHAMVAVQVPPRPVTHSKPPVLWGPAARWMHCRATEQSHARTASPVLPGRAGPGATPSRHWQHLKSPGSLCSSRSHSAVALSQPDHPNRHWCHLLLSQAGMCHSHSLVESYSCADYHDLGSEIAWHRNPMRHKACLLGHLAEHLQSDKIENQLRRSAIHEYCSFKDCLTVHDLMQLAVGRVQVHIVLHPLSW